MNNRYLDFDVLDSEWIYIRDYKRQDKDYILTEYKPYGHNHMFSRSSLNYRYLDVLNNIYILERND